MSDVRKVIFCACSFATGLHVSRTNLSFRASEAVQRRKTRTNWKRRHWCTPVDQSEGARRCRCDVIGDAIVSTLPDMVAQKITRVTRYLENKDADEKKQKRSLTLISHCYASSEFV